MLTSKLASRLRSLAYCRRASIFVHEDPVAIFQLAETVQKPDDLSICTAEPEEFSTLAQEVGLSEFECQRRRAMGDVCYIVFDKQRTPITMLWVHTGSCYVRGMAYLLQGSPSDAYMYSIFTKPSARGRGIYTYSLIWVSADLFKKKYGKIIQMIEANNHIPLAVIPKLHFIQTEAITHIQLLGMRYTLVRNLRLRRLSHHVELEPPRQVAII
jgi:hypothetical protein